MASAIVEGREARSEGEGHADGVARGVPQKANLRKPGGKADLKVRLYVRSHSVALDSGVHSSVVHSSVGRSS
jgi:hypothetical protein